MAMATTTTPRPTAEQRKGRRAVALRPGHFRIQHNGLRCPHHHPTPADASTCTWSNPQD